MVKIYGESGASFSSMAAYVSLEDYESLKAALREALDRWEADRDRDYMPSERIRALRAKFLDDKIGGHMKIYVRRRHIEKGHAGHCKKCPIALAIRETTGERVNVGWTSIWFRKADISLPDAAIQFIHCFDSGKPVKPFAFTIRA